MEGEQSTEQPMKESPQQPTGGRQMKEDSGKVYAYYNIFINLAKFLGAILSVAKFLEMLTYVVQIKNDIATMNETWNKMFGQTIAKLELIGEKLKFVDDKVNFVKYQVGLVDNEVKTKWSILDNKLEHNFPSFYEGWVYYIVLVLLVFISICHIYVIVVVRANNK
ncbi:unnamed protein product [Rhizophagus irregularis]|nr:unnamed protein product [Rhizophagus irregularis]